MKLTSTVAMASIDAVATGAAAVAGVAATGVALANVPVRLGAELLSGTPGAASARRCWRGPDRGWIEVCGLDGGDGRELGAAVVAAVSELPGVISARLNYPLSRVVVEFGTEAPTARTLCETLARAENSWRTTDQLDTWRRAIDLPGDTAPMADKVAAAAAAGAGLWAALTGRLFLLPRLPLAVAAVVAALDYQPKVRSALERRWGTANVDTALALAAAVAHTLTLAPPALAIDLLTHLVKVGEARAGQRAWHRYEPALARHADCADFAGRPPHERPRPRPTGPVERHADRSGWVQLVGAVTIGAIARSLDAAATAVLVATPKATRTTRESFAATLGRGLADRHAVLPLYPEALRRLDRVDAVLIDPRVLCTDELRVAGIRGATEHQLTAAWEWAQEQVPAGRWDCGWHPVDGRSVTGLPDRFEVLVRQTHHPLASALAAEAHDSGAEVVSLDVDMLGELRSGFDELCPVTGSLDADVAGAVRNLQRRGHTVAVVSSAAPGALAAADVAIGVTPRRDEAPPPWHAHLVVGDLSGAWQVLHALPAARAASRRAVELSVGGSLLGGLLMVPGVRGRGPGPVATGAAAGLATGHWLARHSLRTTAPPPVTAHEWHAMSVEQVRRVLPPVDRTAPQRPTDRGFAVLAAARAVVSRPGRALWEFATAVRAVLSDPLTPVLAVGSAAGAVLGSPVDAVLVGSVLVGNAVLAAAQQLHAQRVLERLLAHQIPPARVVRENVRQHSPRRYLGVAADSVRPGDVIEVRPDEVVPADGRLVGVVDLEVDESSLTGESLPVTKQVQATPGVPLAERRCMLFAGTTVLTGTAVAVVTAVGDQTQAHRAAGTASGPAQAEAHRVGLQSQLSELTRRVLPFSLAGGALVTVLGLLRSGRLREAVTSGVAVSVAAVPEGLPLVATLGQQASAHRLTRSGALVRTSQSVEALGRLDVVCFDKTGTLSENRLRVAKVIAAPGWSAGEVLECAALATPAPNGRRYEHQTDNAIVEEAERVVEHPLMRAERLAHLPFRSGRAYSASVSGSVLSIKGAPEVVLAACIDVTAELSRTVGRMAADGLRVIAVGRRHLSAAQLHAVAADQDALADLCVDGLHIAGLIGLADTARPAAAGVLAALREQQIGVRLITGDHPITAAAIATELGVPVSVDDVISGSEWEALPRREQERAVTECVVFARMSPENKVQIVQTLERLGQVCAMVGDGANDAAAIRAATVGIGVVSRGSDPARTAADIVLLDGRIESLLEAVEEGRQLWRRVQAAVSVLLGGNAGEVAFALIGSVISGRSPLNARQLLLVNMLTDALPAAALAVSPPTARMRGGHGPDRAALWRTVAVRGGTTAAAATVAWLLGRLTGRPRRASTMALIALVATQLGQTLLDSHARPVVLTAFGSLLAMATVVSIPGISQLLGCTPLGPIGWTQALGTALLATAAAGVAPTVIARLGAGEAQAETAPESVAPDDQWTDLFSMSSSPARHINAYTSSNGRSSSPATTLANGSATKPLASDTAGTVTPAASASANSS